MFTKATLKDGRMASLSYQLISIKGVDYYLSRISLPQKKDDRRSKISPVHVRFSGHLTKPFSAGNLWKRRIMVKYPEDGSPGRCRTGSGEEVFGTTGSRTVVERNLPVTFTFVCWRWATKMSTAPAFKVNQGQLSGHSVLSSRLESQLPTRCPSRNLRF